MIVIPVAVLLVVLLLVWRRRRTSTLAGLRSDRPVYQVSPPSGRVGNLKRSRL